MFLKNKSVIEEDIKLRKPSITIQEFLRKFAKYKDLNLEQGISFPRKAGSKGKKITPMVQIAKPEHAQSISEIFKQVYRNTYPYKEMENPQDIREMIEDPDYIWMVFKINEDQVIGCVAIKYNAVNRSNYLHGFAIKKEYQGLTSLPKLAIAAWTVLLKKYEKRALIWFGEARTAHSKSQFMSDLLGLKPIAFFPKKDIFFDRVESVVLLILYDEDLIKEYRREDTPNIIPRALPSYFYALKRYNLEVPMISNHVTLDFDKKLIKSIKQNLIYQEDKDKSSNHLITISISNSESYISINHQAYEHIFENTDYKVSSEEELFVFVEEIKALIDEYNIRYWEFFVSAYHPTHQMILYDAGLKPFGYVPCFKFVKEEDIFEDQIAFIYYLGNANRNVKMIPETENFLRTIKPSWDF